MNTAIFLTQENKQAMAESIRLLAAKQHTIVNGALIVCHQSCISEKEAKRIANPLIEKFRTGAMIKTASNTRIPHDGQLAVMFSKFVALAYIRYPGAWLIIDTPADARVENWAKAALDQHNLHGGKVVGCAHQEGKSLLTYGPVTIQLHVKTMKMLHFATNESWRSRGRFLLMNAGLKAVEPEKAVFCEIGAQPATKAEVKPQAAAETDADEREALMKAIEKHTGKRPHHFTGIDKLRELVQQIDPSASV